MLIGGGAVIVALLGVIGFLLTRGDDNKPANTSGGAVIAQGEAQPKPRDLIDEARRQEQEAEEARRRQKEAEAAAAGEGPTDPQKRLAPPSMSRTTPFQPDPAANLPDIDSNDVVSSSGNRVAWLFADGTGFAKKEDMWVYSGPLAVLAIRTGGNGEVAFYETLRTDNFVELYNQQRHIRVRLMSNEVQAFNLVDNTKAVKGGRRLGNSTASASAWLTRFRLPKRTMWSPIEPDPTNLPPLVAAVEKQVARIDVRTKDGAGNGSGFLLDESGRIITNYHVIEECEFASAVFKNAGPNGTEVKVPIAGYLYADPKRDIAVLQAVLPPGFKFRGLPMSKETRKGENVVAFGAPLGLDATTSTGIISGYRDPDDLKTMLGIEGFAGNWIQTTTPISPGNSGGPLVNLSGEVVAINTMTLTRGQQLNFAISAGDILDVVSKSAPIPKKLKPDDLPVASHRAIAPPPGADGRSRRTGRQIRIPVGPRSYIPLWPIEDTAEGRKHLSELDELVVSMVPDISMLIADKNGVVKSAIEDAAGKSVRNAEIRVVIDEGPVLIIAPELKKASEHQLNLQMFAHLYIVHNGEALRIWRGSEDMGRVSKTLLKRGSIGKKTRTKMAEFFSRFTEDVKNANASTKEAEEKKDRESNPFKSGAMDDSPK
ncbi:MAG: S1C family serine protease [Planctomycetaceae bacterium]